MKLACTRMSTLFSLQGIIVKAGLSNSYLVKLHRKKNIKTWEDILRKNAVVKTKTKRIFKKAALMGAGTLQISQ